MPHGDHTRGEVVAPRSRFYQGPFGRICPELEPWSPPGKTDSQVPDHFLQIARDEMIEVPGKTPTEIAQNPALQDPFNSRIPAGYTYFGQFVDHDITFDPASSLMRQNDPGGLLNHRTPRLDLDCVYGRGPSDSPYLYDQTDRGKLLIGGIAGTNLPDLPRNSQGRALIGDMRNDENAIVSQLQLAFLKAHNELVDRARAAGRADPFEAARTTLRWLYQHVVWHDFVRQITLPSVFDAALGLETRPGGRKVWKLGLSDVYKWRNQPFMPVEFSVASYRFGHSMVRNAYQTNAPHRGFNNFVPIFDNTAGGSPDDLRGFRPMDKLNVVQWDWFLKMTTSTGPFPQVASKIDTKLANALAVLHEDVPGSPMNVLAFRNLMRGWRFDLPSGTAVARKFGLPTIPIAPDHDALWLYVLKEAETLPGADAGQRLGPVGSSIACAVFAGLLLGDPKSWLNIAPEWKPSDDPLLTADDNKDKDAANPDVWTLGSIIRIAGVPVAGADF